MAPVVSVVSVVCSALHTAPG